MKNFLWSISLFTFLINFTPAFSQINPPDFICITGDTLFWNPTPDPCGTFNSYDIFFSTLPSGPFNLLISIDDPDQLFYPFDNPTNDTFYFYLQSNLDCPGQPTLSSDTLENLSPIPPILQKASVEGGQVLIQWIAGGSPETIGHIIYRETINGTIPIDTVFSGNTYIDPNALPGDQSELYYVTSLDACGNTSLFPPPHRTIFVDGTPNACQQQVELQWNQYINWTTGVENQVLLLSIDDGPLEVVDTISASDSTYIYSGLNDSLKYCFNIQANQSQDTIEVFSNVYCFTADIIQPIRNLDLKNVSVLPNNEVELNWNWDNNAEINQVLIFNGTDPQELLEVNAFPPTFPLEVTNELVEPSGTPNLAKQYYQISTIDDCDSIANSNIASTIFLEGTPNEDRTNLLQWTPLDIEGANVAAYEIYKIVNNFEVKIGEVAGMTNTFVDESIDPNLERDAQNCYLVIARGVYDFDNGSTELIRSRSNIACVDQPSSVFVPNAFAPRGRNQEFKPVIVFGASATSYRLLIFDRWGRQVFQTNDINQGWNGQYDGKDMPQGVYAYQLRLVQPDGKVIEKTGSVMLLR